MAIIIDKDICIGCGRCVELCPAEAITVDESLKKAVIDSRKCSECGICINRCKKNAISTNGSDIQDDKFFTDINNKLLTRGAGYDTGKTLSISHSRSMGQGRVPGHGCGTGSGRGIGFSRCTGRRRNMGSGQGAGGFTSRQTPDTTTGCLCPICVIIITHQAGIPCMQLQCPKCGNLLIRK